MSLCSYTLRSLRSLTVVLRRDARYCLRKEASPAYCEHLKSAYEQPGKPSAGFLVCRESPLAPAWQSLNRICKLTCLVVDLLHAQVPDHAYRCAARRCKYIGVGNQSRVIRSANLLDIVLHYEA